MDVLLFKKLTHEFEKNVLNTASTSKSEHNSGVVGTGTIKMSER